MRKGDYKAVLVAKPFGPGTWKLYNVTEDPGETRDLSKEQPAILKELKAAWDQYAKDVGGVLSQGSAL
jgi:arylsulfatase